GERVGGGQGGVPTQIHLHRRGEPPQRPIRLRPRWQAVRERGLGQVHLRGHRLHPPLIGPTVAGQETDRGGITGEGAIGERVDDPNPHAGNRSRSTDRHPPSTVVAARTSPSRTSHRPVRPVSSPVGRTGPGTSSRAVNVPSGVRVTVASEKSRNRRANGYQAL